MLIYTQAIYRFRQNFSCCRLPSMYAAWSTGMCVYTCMYVCVYACVFVHTVSSQPFLYVRMYEHAKVPIYIHTHIHTYKHVNIDMYVTASGKAQLQRDFVVSVIKITMLAVYVWFRCKCMKENYDAVCVHVANRHGWIHVICMYVCMCVCICICVYAWCPGLLYMSECICIRVCSCACMHVSLYTKICIEDSHVACLCAWMCTCMYIKYIHGMYAYTYVHVSPLHIGLIETGFVVSMYVHVYMYNTYKYVYV